MHKRILRGCLLFISLMAVFLLHFSAGVMFFGFVAWLALNAWNFYLPRFCRQVDIWSLAMGVVGAVYIFAVDKEVKYTVGQSLRGTIGFVNRLLPASKKEVKYDKR